MVWLLWVFVEGPGPLTDGHGARWVLRISHIQLYQRLFQSVSSSLCLTACLPFFLALGEERLQCSVFCSRSLSLLFGFI